MTKSATPRRTPKLRFPEFRKAPGWKTRSLGLLLNLKYGESLRQEDRNEGTIPVMGSNGIVGYHNEALIKGPAIVVGRKGSVGQITWIESDCFPIDTTFYVENKDCSKTSMEFLYRLLQTSNLEQMRDPGAVPGLNRSEVHSLETTLPEPAEQHKIAECLGSLDELIGAESRKLDALKAHKKGLMQQLFPREGETHPRLRFPEFGGAGAWEEKTLANACDMQAGKFVRATDIKDQPANELFPCYGGNGLRGYTPTYTHEGVYPLIGRQGALCGNVKLCTGTFHATEHAVVASPKQGIDVGWLYYALDLLNLNRFATGQAQPGLSVDVLEKVVLAIPKLESEQHRIASCLSSLDDLIAAQGDKVAALKTHKKGLMQRLFPSPEATGATRVLPLRPAEGGA